jgi:hypothetical protein
MGSFTIMFGLVHVIIVSSFMNSRLSMTAPSDQSTTVFTGVFVVIWCGAGMVTVNSKLLGGKM